MAAILGEGGIHDKGVSSLFSCSLRPIRTFSSYMLDEGSVEDWVYALTHAWQLVAGIVLSPEPDLFLAAIGAVASCLDQVPTAEDLSLRWPMVAFGAWRAAMTFHAQYHRFACHHSEGHRPSDSPTASLARRFAGSLRSRASLTPLVRAVPDGSPGQFGRRPRLPPIGERGCGFTPAKLAAPAGIGGGTTLKAWAAAYVESFVGHHDMPPALRAAAWLRRHYRGRCVLAKICGEVGVSRAALLRGFGAIYGMSPLEFVTRLRLRDAAARLRRGRGTLDTVAADVGYADGKTLREALRSRTGLTPNEIRAMPAWEFDAVCHRRLFLPPAFESTTGAPELIATSPRRLP